MNKKVDLKADQISLLGKPNSTFLWYPQDDEKTFKNNLKENPTDPSLLYYVKNPINYTVNSNRFRTVDEFSLEDPGNVFLGCSHTYGIGLHQEHTWAYKVNSVIGGKFWNLGVPGSSLQMAYLMLLRYYKDMNIKNVFMYHPHLHRYLTYNNDKWHNLSIHNFNQTEAKSRLSKRTVSNYISTEYSYLNFSAYSNAIKYLCNKLNVPLYLITSFPNVDYNNLPDDNINARDLKHFPTTSHNYLANEFLKKYNLKQTNNYSEADFHVSNEIENVLINKNI